MFPSGSIKVCPFSSYYGKVKTGRITHHDFIFAGYSCLDQEE
jgi:hypothetical protein